MSTEHKNTPNSSRIGNYWYVWQAQKLAGGNDFQNSMHQKQTAGFLSGSCREYVACCNLVNKYGKIAVHSRSAVISSTLSPSVNSRSLFRISNMFYLTQLARIFITVYSRNFIGRTPLRLYKIPWAGLDVIGSDGFRATYRDYVSVFSNRQGMF